MISEEVGGREEAGGCRDQGETPPGQDWAETGRREKEKGKADKGKENVDIVLNMKKLHFKESS